MKAGSSTGARHSFRISVKVSGDVERTVRIGYVHADGVIYGGDTKSWAANTFWNPLTEPGAARWCALTPPKLLEIRGVVAFTDSLNRITENGLSTPFEPRDRRLPKS